MDPIGIKSDGRRRWVAREPRDALHRPQAEGKHELRVEGGGTKPRLEVQHDVIRCVKGVGDPVGPGPDAGTPSE